MRGRCQWLLMYLFIIQNIVCAMWCCVCLHGLAECVRVHVVWGLACNLNLLSLDELILKVTDNKMCRQDKSKTVAQPQEQQH